MNLAVTGGPSASTASPSTNRSTSKSWRAELRLSFEHNEEKTLLRRSHSGPLMVQRPFYPEGAVCHAYVLHPPGGIVGGDSLRIDTNVANDASALVTTPGANKFYGSDGRLAELHQHILLDNSAIEWMPQESIFFDRCNVAQQLRIDLTSASRFIGWDISCFGRPAGNYVFCSGGVFSQLALYLDNRPLLIERLRVNGAIDLSRLSGLKGCTTSATMLAIAPNLAGDELIDRIREILNGSAEFAVTQIETLFVIRYLGHSTEAARNGFIKVWQLLRPIVMHRNAVMPRIWAT